LRREGCSIAELQRWLRKKRIKVVHSTVARWLEQQDG
jgi:arginine repressor